MNDCKEADKEGRVRLGPQHANKQWQMIETEGGMIVLVPIIPAVNEDLITVFDQAFKKHKKTLDALK